jgi:ribose 5-phosphate isomerase B
MRAVITERDIPYTGDLKVERGALITPSARDLARDRGVRILEVDAGELQQAPPAKTVAIGADHGGFAMKEQVLKPLLAELGLHAQDVGVSDASPADYPDIALQVATLVHNGKAARGIVVDGAGIGSAMAANKVPGVRAALCYDRASARNSREHNDANVLTLGGRLLTPSQAEEVVRVWLSTPFGGGRHQARIDKITAIEKAYLK